MNPTLSNFVSRRLGIALLGLTLPSVGALAQVTVPTYRINLANETAFVIDNTSTGFDMDIVDDNGTTLSYTNVQGTSQTYNLSSLADGPVWIRTSQNKEWLLHKYTTPLQGSITQIQNAHPSVINTTPENIGNPTQVTNYDFLVTYPEPLSSDLTATHAPLTNGTFARVPYDPVPSRSLETPESFIQFPSPYVYYVNIEDMVYDSQGYIWMIYMEDGWRYIRKYQENTNLEPGTTNSPLTLVSSHWITGLSNTFGQYEKVYLEIDENNTLYFLCNPGVGSSKRIVEVSTSGTPTITRDRIIPSFAYGYQGTQASNSLAGNIEFAVAKDGSEFAILASATTDKVKVWNTSDLSIKYDELPSSFALHDIAYGMGNSLYATWSHFYWGNNITRCKPSGNNPATQTLTTVGVNGISAASINGGIAVDNNGFVHLAGTILDPTLEVKFTVDGFTNSDEYTVHGVHNGKLLTSRVQLVEGGAYKHASTWPQPRTQYLMEANASGPGNFTFCQNLNAGTHTGFAGVGNTSNSYCRDIIDLSAPKLVLKSGVFPTTDIPVGLNNLVFTFNEDIQVINNRLAGTLELYDAQYNLIKEYTNTVFSTNGNQLTVAVNWRLAYNSTYYLVPKPNIVYDIAGNAFAGLSQPIQIQTESGLGWRDNLAGMAEAKLQAYPNPSQDQVTISLPAGVSEGTLTVYDATGRTVHTQTISAGSVALNLSTWKPGMYQARLVAPEGQWHTPILKQ